MRASTRYKRNYFDEIPFGDADNFFNYFKELQTIRNELSHRSGKNFFDDRNTARAFDTMILIAEELDEDTATKLRRLKKLRAGTFA